MDVAALVVWATLNAQITLASGATLDAGPYYARTLCEVHRVATSETVFIADPSLGERICWVGRPVVVGPKSKNRIKGALLAMGLHVIARRDPGREPVLVLASVDQKLGGLQRPGDPATKMTTRIIVLQKAEADYIVECLKPELEAIEKELSEDLPRSILVPDPRTGKIIVRARSLAVVDEILALIRALDVPKPTNRPKLTSYKCKTQRAEGLVALFDEVWEGEKRANIHLVPHSATNTVLIRCPRQVLPEALDLLRSLDTEAEPSAGASDSRSEESKPEEPVSEDDPAATSGERRNVERPRARPREKAVTPRRS